MADTMSLPTGGPTREEIAKIEIGQTDVSPSVSRGQKGLGDYTVPMANKFAADGDPNTLGEIYAYGFRNAHRLSWDIDGTMFASDIGMDHIEEINIVRNGENYQGERQRLRAHH